MVAPLCDKNEKIVILLIAEKQISNGIYFLKLRKCL